MRMRTGAMGAATCAYILQTDHACISYSTYPHAAFVCQQSLLDIAMMHGQKPTSGLPDHYWVPWYQKLRHQTWVGWQV